ncbi:hypothetical protein RKE38_10360 [Phycicoccus sp. M110.8]|uniref:hypothetical protein n=1 Tax=Phycicoccus sp. M110.8 TaxID=3075433 RepID=UPI0028FD8343|nr:hypothetical protein [Phycicoccus sp. M110.8]MDU0314087.1 hypothetical protein [Phycicoccus sp. M110.8]
MAVDPTITAAVLAELGNNPVMLVDVVVDELEYRATQPQTAHLAQSALDTVPTNWIRVDTGRYVDLGQVQDAQADVADGRPLNDDMQHWAESTIIAMGRSAAQTTSTSVKMLLSEDYDARRVASLVPQMSATSIHGLLHSRVHANHLTATQAATMADLLKGADRGPEVTAEDFADPTGRRLGRVGHPRPPRP